MAGNTKIDLQHAARTRAARYPPRALDDNLASTSDEEYQAIDNVNYVDTHPSPLESPSEIPNDEVVSMIPFFPLFVLPSI